MGRVLLAIGAVLGCVGVAAGTFGAHAIRQRVTPGLLDDWKRRLSLGATEA